MADDVRYARAIPRQMSLQDVRRAGLGLWARCESARCGAEAPVDPRPWEAQGLERIRLADLEGRLRCLCGARRARVSAGAPVATYGRGPIYPFS